MQVLVTGSKGLLGSWILPELKKKHEVFEYDIKDHHDILNYGQLLDHMQGKDAVIHLAGLPHREAGKSWSDFETTNYKGSQNVLIACEEAGVKKLVYASSGNVYCFGDGLQDDLEPPIKLNNYPKLDDMHWYPRSKIMVEKFYKKTRANTQIVILRPNHLAPTPPDVMDLWRGATITRERLVKYFVNAVELDKDYVIYDVIEPTENYPSSLEAAKDLDC